MAGYLELLHGNLSTPYVCAGSKDGVKVLRSSRTADTVAMSVSTVLDGIFKPTDDKQASIALFKYMYKQRIRHPTMIGYFELGASRDETIGLIHSQLALSNTITDSVRASIHAHLNLNLRRWNEVRCTGKYQQHLRMFNDWAMTQTFVPTRTDLPVVHLGDNGVPICSGVVDLIAQQPDESYVMVVWKCPIFDGWIAHSQTAVDKYGVVPDTEFARYSLRLSLYAEMAASTYGYDVGDKMYVAEINAMHFRVQTHQCTNYRPLARELLKDLNKHAVV